MNDRGSDPSSGPFHQRGGWEEERWSGPWRELFSLVPQMAKKMNEAGASIITIEVDGGVVRRLIRPDQKDLEAHARFEGMPLVTTEGWLFETLAKVRRDRPKPNEKIEVYAYTALEGMPLIITEDRLLETLAKGGRDRPKPNEKIEVYAYTALLAAVWA